MSARATRASVLAGAVAGAAAALAAPAGARAQAPTVTASLTMDQAVTLAFQQNRDVIAAKLEIQAAELDVVAARIYPNPILQYNLGNLVLGAANPQGMGVTSGFFGQTVQSVGVSEIIDVWAKRSARTRVAEEGVQRRRFVTEDALREIAYAVRSAFADVLREQEERQLAIDMAARYADTVRLSQARFRAGDISEAELRKIELEGLHYQNDVIDAEMQLDVARNKMAGLLALTSPRQLPPQLSGGKAAATASPADVAHLTEEALQKRPDLLAAGAARKQGDAALASARREAYPDISLGATYTHSNFEVSGDNPNTLALGVTLPLPLFDRNQAGIGRAEFDIRRADNDIERLRLQVAREVSEVARKSDRARAVLDLYEGAPAMRERAETALKVAEKSYKAGAISLLELLEAQRTYLATLGGYLRAIYDVRQAGVDVKHAVGE
jgi:cobalt-zinc-cadmium efflux system outer membrane protein